MFNQLLYRYRYWSIGLAALFTVWVFVALWVFVPYTDFFYFWRPDDQLVVDQVAPESLAYELLQSGDLIEAIDGRPVTRRAAFFTTPLKPSYTFDILRDGRSLSVEIPINSALTSVGFFQRVPAMILTLAFLITGIVVLQFSRPDNEVAIQVGYIFLGSAVAIIGLQGELLGAIGAWLSRLVWMLAHVGTLYLGFVPISRAPSAKIRTIFKWLVLFAVASGIGAVLEAAVLFPQGTSLDRLLGMGFYELSLLLSGLLWLVVLAALIVRAYTIKEPYERQQIQILLYFIALGTLPVTVLTLIPRALLDVTLIPFPVGILLFTLVPLGFLYVIYRRGYLRLDVVFSNTTVFITLTVGVVALYGTGLYFLNSLFDFDLENILPATLLLIPVLVIIRLTGQTLDEWISALFFGSVPVNRALPQFAAALSSQPENKTLQSIVESLAADLNLTEAALVLKGEGNQLEPFALIRVDRWRPLASFETFHKPLLRSSHNRHLLFSEYEWIELLVPVIVRREQIGFLALSRPRNGFFNSRQIVFLSRVADMIAVGSEAIYLFEASRNLSLQLLSAQEMERKNLATQIHDKPLQTLAFVHHGLRQVINGQPSSATNKELGRQGDLLQQAITDLRQICAGLYPPVIEQGLDLVVSEVTHHFRNAYGLDIETDVLIPDALDASVDVSTVVYRVLTESLNNVVKHAGTTQAHIQLYRQNGHLVLTVMDNGVGSGLPDLSLTELTRLQHLGVRGMFEWGKMVNGQLRIKANQPTGTTVQLEIPMTT